MNRNFLSTIDYGLVVPACVLVIISLATLFSINIELFKSQLIFFAISVFFLIFFSQLNYSFTKRYSLPIYILSLILLILVLVFGVESRGSVRWFELFGIKIQFSEIIKPFLALSLAFFLSENKNSSYRIFFIALGMLAPVTFLIFMQPDLGNAIIFVFVVVLTLFVYGFPLRLFLLGLVCLGLFLPFFWNFLEDYQKQRIINFLNPTDPMGLSYNAIQSVITVGSGQIFGRGLGQGSQSELRFLPEHHTDFIFATLAEGLGFIGVAVIILCLGFLLYRIFIIFSNARDLFYKLFCITTFFFILVQFFINIGMNIGILPVVGITLPFVSYGGSSLLSSFIFLGIASSMSRSSNASKDHSEGVEITVG